MNVSKINDNLSITKECSSDKCDGFKVLFALNLLRCGGGDGRVSGNSRICGHIFFAIHH